MSDYKAKIHQIRFWLRHDPPQTPLGAPPDSLAGFKGPTSKGREERGRKGGQGGKGRDKEKGKGRERERRREGRGRGERDGRDNLGGRGKGREKGREKRRGGKI